MQERSYRLPMYSIERTSHIPTSQENFSIDTHLSSSTAIIANESQNEIETLTSTSTPELNLLLDKLTEILRFRSGCRRHFGTIQQQTSNVSTTNLKRLQADNFEPLYNTDNVSSTGCNGSSGCTGAWKSLNMHHKSLISSRSSHHNHNHHHHHHHRHHLERNRRLPGLLQHLIDEGNLIKEAVHRLKSQRFSHTFKQQTSNVVNTPSTPIAKSTVRLTPSSSSVVLNDTSTQLNSSPNRTLSWFSVFGVNPSATSMEIGIHDG